MSLYKIQNQFLKTIKLLKIKPIFYYQGDGFLVLYEIKPQY